MTTIYDIENNITVRGIIIINPHLLLKTEYCIEQINKETGEIDIEKRKYTMKEALLYAMLLIVRKQSYIKSGFISDSDIKNHDIHQQLMAYVQQNLERLESA